MDGFEWKQTMQGGGAPRWARMDPSPPTIAHEKAQRCTLSTLPLALDAPPSDSDDAPSVRHNAG
ncbi:hypothetical protein Dimus_035810, partial [Dionaea muscipula]